MGAPNSGKRSRMDGETTLLWVFITVVVLGVGSVDRRRASGVNVVW
jgi:hypothetical protein